MSAPKRPINLGALQESDEYRAYVLGMAVRELGSIVRDLDDFTPAYLRAAYDQLEQDWQEAKSRAGAKVVNLRVEARQSLAAAGIALERGGGNRDVKLSDIADQNYLPKKPED